MKDVKRLFSTILALCFLAALLFAACSSSAGGGNDNKESDANTSAGGTGEPGEGEGTGPGPGEGEGAGPGEGEGSGGGPTITSCASDQGCPAGNFCDPDTQKCVQGVICTDDYQCVGQPLAFCDKSRGVCRNFKLLCTECQQDTDCGIIPSTGDFNQCITVGGLNYCGRACGKLACPAGFTCDKSFVGLPPNDGQCVPRNGECSAIPCATDEDCGFGMKCIAVVTGPDDQGVQASYGVCSEACEADADCPTGLICNEVIGACTEKCDPYENAGFSNCPSGDACHFNGRCGDACTTDADCVREGWPEGLLCEQPQGRCRISGCERDQDCGTGLGVYCDLIDNDCKDGCRTNEDCPTMMICVDKGYAGELSTEVPLCNAPPCDCVPPPCTLRGANISCGVFEFCCGEVPDIQCPSDAQDGQCFQAWYPDNGQPNKPIHPCDGNEPMCFCRNCDPNQEGSCPDGQAPGGYDGNCYEFQDQDGNKMGNFCLNRCRDNGDCPRGVKCEEQEVQQQGGGTSKELVCNMLKCPLYNPQTPASGTGQSQPPPP